MVALRIALRYLFAKKSHTAVNVISFISMAGIAVAAMAMVCVLSVFNGFRDIASSRLSAVDPDILVTPAEGAVIDDADSLSRVIASVPGVAMAAPVLEQKALAIYDGAQIPVTVRGVPEGYTGLTALGSQVIDGVMIDPADTTLRAEGYLHPAALLSVGAAINTGARPSLESTLLLTVPRRRGRINPAMPMAAFVTDTLYVSGVYQTNQPDYDEDLVFIPLRDARRLFDYTVQASTVEVGVTPGADEGDVVEALRGALGDGYKVADRLAQQEDAFRMIAVEKWVTFLMLVFVLVMASFNILSTLSMLIIEKEGNLAILSALGAPRAMTRHIFLDEGILIAALGGMAGIALGVILALVQQHFGLIELGGDHSQMSVIAYPCRLAGADVLVTAVVVAVIGTLSGFISSRSV